MKKISTSLLAVIFVVANLTAQEPVFLKGSKVLNLGIGLGSTLYSGTYYKSQVPPVSASLEIGVVDNILEKGVVGVGPYIGYTSYKYEYMDWGWKYSNIIIGVRGNFHYPLVDKLDTYTGLLLGYNISSSREFGDPVPGWDYSYTAGGVAYSWFVGARYYIRETFALMGELGYGISYLNLGVALNF